MSDKNLRDDLFYEQKNGYDLIDTDERIAVEDYCEGYKAYLNVSRTEREAVKEAIALAQEHGFVPFEPGMDIQPGMKLYRSNRGKALLLAVVGKKSLSEGCHVAAAHVDAPRLDLKQLPLYEDSELAYFKTHYYGGIKKYQWAAIPLELHGVVTLKSGENVDVVIGRDKDDPQLVITDLLPHLAADQMKKGATEIIPGEKLNILIGSQPYDDEGKDRVKLAVMSILNDSYGITEEDFLSAELEIVPGFDVRDIGLDRSLIGGYGHDDRVCAYPALTSLFSLTVPEFTAVTLLADKEETGSEGNTGTQSEFFRYFIADLAAMYGEEPRHVLSRSMCLSADVNAALDPIYAGVMDARNAARINHGAVLTKYTGGSAKGGTSDASAELMGRFRRIMDENDVCWQIGELGRVEAGGGGTVAKYIANLDVETVDLGVPVLSMHAPFEIVSKLDVYQAHKAFAALLSRKD